jgi:hypothetical protein
VTSARAGNVGDMARAAWTYELPPATADGVWLEEYLVYDGEGFPVGRVFAVLEHEGSRWLGIEREPLPTRHDRRVVPFQVIGEIDHENVAVHLTLEPGEIEAALELDPGNGVEQGGEAQRVTRIPPIELPARRDPLVRGPVDRGIAVGATVLALFGVLALWAVFVFWGSRNGSTTLPFLAVPGLLFGAAAFLGYRAWSQPWLQRR